MSDWATQFIFTRFDLHQPLTVDTVAGWLREVRAEALEEAARVAEASPDSHWGPTIAAAIRALGKEKT